VKIPLAAGSQITVATAPDDAVVLRPPPPLEAVADVGAAVRDAVRFPLAGEPLEALVTPGGTATIVVDHPSLPVPSTVNDPRQQALAAAADELERIGVPSHRQTLLVAGGLERRAGRRELERLVWPEFARRFRGRVLLHDAAAPDLHALDGAGQGDLLVNRALSETDAVVCVSAAESVLHGGPSCLLAAAGAELIRRAGAQSLLRTSGSRGWDLAVELERRLAARVPLVGISLVLDHPRFGGALGGFPHEHGAVMRAARSPLALGFRALPALARRRILQSLPRELSAAAVYAGPPSVAHAEALLRSTEARTTELDTQLDAICIGIPPTTPHLPRQRTNPLSAAYHALGLALRLWRDGFPVVDGGTAIIVHDFQRRFSHGQHPYRMFFRAIRDGIGAEPLADAERMALDHRDVEAYRGGRACHPLLPFADWEGCAPALARLGAVVVAGCRDATAARRLGFVPTHGLSAALEMAHGRAGRAPRIGFVVAPPYFPLQVATPT
jgi:hypothetical protein